MAETRRHGETEHGETRGGAQDGGATGDAAAAVFDVDGTLVDSGYLHTLAWWEALRQYGHTVPMARIQRSIGMGTEMLLDHVLGEDRDRDQTAALDEAHTALVARFWPAFAPLPGAADLLRACAKRGWKVVVASSASERELEVLLKVIDADDAITAVTGADDVEEAKPAPDVVGAALRKAGADPGRSVMIGDTVWDVRAAERAGVRCVTVLTGGFGRAELLDAGALEAHEHTAALLADLDRSILGGPAGA
jgi:HAD superfamily hydrolase (TIGR01509 family)